MESRNIIDHYHYWKTDAIKADLDQKRHNFSVLISNKLNDFNLGTVIRNSNAFLGKEIIIYGRRNWDKRGSVGTHNYENLSYVREIDDLKFGESTVIGIDNVSNAVPIDDFIWPTNHVIMVFGQEQVGITEELAKLCEKFVYIRQFGSVRSLNVGTASGIAMYDYCNKIVQLSK
jgi:tRNA G18 (ribose-2'-O)-methylase SpoU